MRRFRDVFKRCWCVETGKKKKGNLSGPIKVCEENYSHTQKKNIRDAVGQLARPLESL